MFMSPADVISSWLRGLLAIGLIAAGVWLVANWYQGLPESSGRVEIVSDDRVANESKIGDRLAQPTGTTRSLTPWQRVSAWRPALNRETALLAGGICLLLWSLGGRMFRPSRLLGKPGAPMPKLQPGEIRRLRRPDGTEIHMEISGPANAPTIVLTHGWSLSSEAWGQLQQDWGDTHRLVVWDLPGLGKSTLARHRVFTLDEMARDLDAVIEATGPGPVVLVGHSIGGMIMLTFCRLFPHRLGSRVVKLVLIHTTYVNPLRTTRLGGLFTALQKPLIEPMLHVQIWLSPLFWLLNCLSYWNGSVHSSIRRNGFAGGETNAQRDFLARYYLTDSPAVLAKGTLAMLDYDATATLKTIKIPVLVVGAAQDPVTTVEASQKMAWDITNGKLATLTPAKHFGLLEHHAEFANRTATFCAPHNLAIHLPSVDKAG